MLVVSLLLIGFVNGDPLDCPEEAVELVGDTIATASNVTLWRSCGEIFLQPGWPHNFIRGLQPFFIIPELKFESDLKSENFSNMDHIGSLYEYSANWYFRDKVQDRGQ